LPHIYNKTTKVQVPLLKDMQKLGDRKQYHLGKRSFGNSARSFEVSEIIYSAKKPNQDTCWSARLQEDRTIEKAWILISRIAPAVRGRFSRKWAAVNFCRINLTAKYT